MKGGEERGTRISEERKKALMQRQNLYQSQAIALAAVQLSPM